MRVFPIMALAATLSLPGLPGGAETPSDAPPPRPTAAVGVIHGAGGIGGCTATLIRDDVVLTAAHCVGNGDKPANLVFRTGAYPGVAPVEVRAAEVIAHPLYEPDKGDLPRRMGFDLALIRLSAPVPETAARPIPVSGDEPVREDRILLASWRGAVGNRARERTCPRISSSPLLIVMACDVQPGESGSPLLRQGGGGLEIVGVLAARSGRGAGNRAYAAGASRIGQLFAIAGPALGEP